MEASEIIKKMEKQDRLLSESAVMIAVQKALIEMGYEPLDERVMGVYNAIENVQTANNWTPCSERLPSKEECGHYGSKEFQVTIPQLYGEDKTIAMNYEYAVVRGKEVGRWKWSGRLSPWKVIAWKPMSEPYVQQETDI